jgi:hypothetical protein
MAFREQIDFDIIQKGDLKEGVTHQPFSDVDCRSTEPVIGTPGGLFGELLNLLVSFEMF